MQSSKRETRRRKGSIICKLIMLSLLLVALPISMTSVACAASDEEEEIRGRSTSQQVSKVIEYSKYTADVIIEENTWIKYGKGSFFVFIGEGTTKDISEYSMTLGSVENVLTALLTEEEQEEVYQGGKYYALIYLEDITYSMDSETNAEIRSSFQDYYGSVSSLSMGSAVDIKVEKKKAGEDWESVKKLDKALEISLTIPDLMQNSEREFYMVRNHDGGCTLLEDNDEDDVRITFYTSLFSTFALVYHQPSLFTRVFGDGGCIWHVISLIFTMFYVGMLMILGKTKRRVLGLTVMAMGINIAFRLLGNCSLDNLFFYVACSVVLAISLFQVEKIYIQQRRKKN